MITKAFARAFEIKEARNWDKIYCAVDIHGTIVKPNYSKETLPTEFYKYAKEVLQDLSKRNDVVLILYTCSFPEEIEKYLEFFKEHEINFEYVNSNPEVENNTYGYFNDKFYFNILLEDKAGFDGETDWNLIQKFMDLHDIATQFIQNLD